MKWWKLMVVATQSIARNKMRSLLTMLGIIIGVGSVISLVGLGRGSQADVEAQVASMGTNLIIVRPGSRDMGGVRGGANTTESLEVDDLVFLQTHATQLGGVTPEVRVQAQVVAGAHNWNTSVYGVSLDYPSIRNTQVADGAFFTRRDLDTRAKVAVLGGTVAGELFPGVSPIGQQVRVGSVPFKVIGVLAEKGENAMGMDQDDLILAPWTTAVYRMGDGKTVRTLMASAKSPEQMEAAKAEITSLLRTHRRIGAGRDPDFNVRDQTEINAMATSITGTLTVLLSSIAGVSLLVGGIGIMNIMLVSVTERTREIGLRMAIGARGGDVLIQFLIEAMILSLAGGILGVALGVGLAHGLGALMGSSVVISPSIVVVAVLFTGVVGVFFGFYPARKAARLNPIEALRYE